MDIRPRGRWQCDRSRRNWRCKAHAKFRNLACSLDWERCSEPTTAEGRKGRRTRGDGVLGDRVDDRNADRERSKTIRGALLSSWRIFWMVLARDPYLFAGVLLIGVSSAECWYMYRKLGETGFRAQWWASYIQEYARTRAKFGWPAWPLHAMWVALVTGVSLLLVGVSKL